MLTFVIRTTGLAEIMATKCKVYYQIYFTVAKIFCCVTIFRKLATHKCTYFSFSKMNGEPFLSESF